MVPIKFIHLYLIFQMAVGIFTCIAFFVMLNAQYRPIHCILYMEFDMI